MPLVKKRLLICLDTMFGDDDVHTVIRWNHVSIDIAYWLGNFRPGFNRQMLVVLCKQSDKIFILKHRTKLPQKYVCGWRLASDRNCAKKINAKTDT